MRLRRLLINPSFETYQGRAATSANNGYFAAAKHRSLVVKPHALAALGPWPQPDLGWVGAPKDHSHYHSAAGAADIFRTLRRPMDRRCALVSLHRCSSVMARPPSAAVEESAVALDFRIVRFVRDLTASPCMSIYATIPQIRYLYYTVEDTALRLSVKRILRA